MFTFEIVPDGSEPFRVTATSRDVSNWERSFKGASIAALEHNARLADFEAIAHFAAIRQGHLNNCSLNEFRQRCDFELIADEDDAESGVALNPTQ